MYTSQPLSAEGNDEDAERICKSVPINLARGDSAHGLPVLMDGPALPATCPKMDSGGTPVKLSILMCAYNEERTIVRAISEVLAEDYPCDMELIVVDDGSTDATPVLLAHVNDLRVIIHRHPRNLGKGASLLSAVSIASGTHILPFDADLEYAPEDITRIIHPVVKGRCDVVYGVRIFGFNTVYHSYRYAMGNRLLTRMANILFNSYISDLHTCMKLIPLALFKSLNLSEPGFGLDTEVTARLLKAGVRPFEVPISYYSRSHAEGKKINWRDGIRCMSILFRVRLLRSARGERSAVLSRAVDQAGVLAAESGPQGWGTVRALGLRDDTQPNAAVTS
jgi:glycosyltransferase involved in cell wall biosynthesis